jgi:toxin ParE1/3/4
VTRRSWTVRLSAAAETDHDEILRWTAERFGIQQAAAYGERLAARVAGLGGGPNIAGARKRDEIGVGLRTLHVGRRGRHIILFRIGSEPDRTIDVLRILHDAMDLARHVLRED